MFPYPKVLFIMPARLGDTLFCTPSIQLFHKHNPNVHIGLLAPTALAAEVFSHNPAIKEVFIAPEEKQLQKISAQYPFAICLHTDTLTSGYLNKLNLPSWIVPFAKDHEKQVEQELEFIRAKLHCDLEDSDKSYRLFPQPENFKHISEIFKKNKVNPDKDILIGCHIGCHGLAKRSWRFWKRYTHEKTWPLKKYIQLFRKVLTAQPDARIVLTGTKNEKEMAKKIAHKIPSCVDLIDQTSVRDMAALMHSLRVFIAADTGALHIGLATPVNLVGMYGLDISPRNYPYPPQPHRIVVHGDSVHNIPVMEIFHAVKQLM